MLSTFTIMSIVTTYVIIKNSSIFFVRLISTILKSNIFNCKHNSHFVLQMGMKYHKADKNQILSLLLFHDFLFFIFCFLFLYRLKENLAIN